MRNPYLKEGRLGDVIAAITTLGAYKFYKLDISRWADRICGNSEAEPHWRALFREHPEFFRFASASKKVSLVWRRQFPRNFYVDAEPEDSPDHEVDGLTESRISRRPLSPEEVAGLIDVAIKLHDRAVEQQRLSVWWIPLFAAGLSFMGALLGSHIFK